MYEYRVNNSITPIEARELVALYQIEQKAEALSRVDDVIHMLNDDIRKLSKSGCTMAWTGWKYSRVISREQFQYLPEIQKRVTEYFRGMGFSVEPDELPKEYEYNKNLYWTIMW